MLHIAFDELPGGGAKKVGARLPGGREREGHRVLKLIAEAEGAAGLVEPGPTPETAGNDLVKQPAVDQQIERAIAGVDLQRLCEGAPARRQGGLRADDRPLVTRATGESFGRLARFAPPHREDETPLL